MPIMKAHKNLWGSCRAFLELVWKERYGSALIQQKQQVHALKVAQESLYIIYIMICLLACAFGVVAHLIC